MDKQRLQEQCGLIWKGNASFCSVLPSGLREYSLHKMTYSQHYSITIKLDGVRNILCIIPEGIYRINRAGVIETCTDTKLNILPTVLDGEYVDFQFVAFDILIHNGQDVRNEPFMKRHIRMFDFVQNEFNFTTSIQIVPKEIYPLSDIHTLVTQDEDKNGIYKIPTYKITPQWYVKRSPHRDYYNADGVIFMDNRSMYDDNSCLFKWKPVPTIDVMVFLSDINIINENNHVQTWYWEYNISQKRSYRAPFQNCSIDNKTKQIILENNNNNNNSRKMICVECRYYYHTKTWSVIKYRPHKTRSNSSRTIKDTLRIIHEHITLSTICNRLKTTTLPISK
jgi:hypothetical protein